MVHKKLVDAEEEYANAVKTHEKQGNTILVCTIVIVILLVITALFRLMDESWASPTKNMTAGEAAIGRDLLLIGYSLASVSKYIMYAGIVALGAIIILNLRRRIYYVDPISRDSQNYAQYVDLQETLIRKLREEEKNLEAEAEKMTEDAKRTALAEDLKSAGERAGETQFSDKGVMDGVLETDGELVLSVEDAWNSIREEDAYESDEK